MDTNMESDMDTDMDIESDTDKDIDLAFSDSGETSDPSGIESGSDMDEDVAGGNAAKRKRGRPVGSLRQRPESPSEDFRVRETRKRKLLSIENLMAVVCCAAMCLGGISQELMVASRENVQSLSHTERKQWLLDYFWSHSRYDEESEKWNFLYVIGTVGVCCSAFKQILGIPSSTFYAVRKMFLKNQKTVSQHRQKRRQSKSMQAIEWLKLYAQNYGEKLPHTGQIHLPPCSTKCHIYDVMVDECQEHFHEPVSLSHFLCIWRSEAPHIAIPKNGRFSKCNVCTEIKIQLGETRDPNKRIALLKKRDRHLKKQNLERQKYYKHQEKAKMFPNRYLSLIIDGMDQSKTSLPHFVHASKFTSAMWKLRVHLIGVVVHGIGIYGFFDLFQYSHSTNLTISILLSVMYSMKDSLPDTLYLQMDNCARENKNRYLLGFMCYLVEIGLFRKIKISFLMVGHTHEDVDQVFSKFSHWLNRHAAMTLDKLMNGFEACFTPRPHSVKTNRVYNITEWITPYLNSMKNHSKPHVFKILRNDTSQKAQLFWKRWSADKEWTECNNYLLKESVTGNPPIVEPNFSEIEENRERLETDVRGSYRFFAKEEDKQWWETFFNEDLDALEEDESWLVDDLLDAKRRRTDTLNTQDDDVFNFELEEDADIPPVIIGKHVPTAGPAPMKSGQYVCTDVPAYAGEWPQIGKVISMQPDTVTLQWYKGSKTTTWKPCTKRVKGTKGKTEAWEENVERCYIWSEGFNLTSTGHLPKKIRETIDNYCH